MLTERYRVSQENMAPRLCRTIVVVVSVALVGVSAASVAYAALTKGILDARANAACHTASNASARVLLGPKPSNAAGWLQEAAGLRAIQAGEIKALERLSPPVALAKLWRTYLGGLHKEERAIEPLFRAYASGDQANIKKVRSSDQRLANRDSGYAGQLGATGCI